MLEIINSVADIKQRIRDIKHRQLQIGFVPTMGALHEGHLSLIRKAKKENDVVVVSIFVNPLQFGECEDFDRYPRSFDYDCKVLSGEKVNILFNPDIPEMYPGHFCTSVVVEGLESKLCGASRPGHFRGVATVVLKFFHLIQPNIAYFGQKDIQQTIIIKRMVSDLDLDVKITVLPIVRDEDGLAISSRNTYLDDKERKKAICLYKALTRAQSLVNSGILQTDKIMREMKSVIKRYPVTNIDYISVVDQNTLEDVPIIKSGNIIALAVKIGNTRLIDNMVIRNYSIS